MAPLPSSLKSNGRALLLLALLALPAHALDVPKGTEIQIRLKSKISTQTARAKDPVEAAVIAPVMVDNQFVIPAGAVVRGTVDKTTASTKADERALLALAFTELEIEGAKYKLAAQISAVDNAREKVDDQGQITGILATDTLTGKLDAGISKIAEKYSGFADILGAAKSAVLKPAEADIVFDAGVEMTLTLTAPLTLKGPSGPGPAAKLQPIPNESALVDLVAREPFQTIAQNPPKPSDITNLMLIGTLDQVKQIFAAAGWSIATSLDTKAKLETFRALAENRGYNEAPVSLLMLDGKPPDLVFEKLNNTFRS
ncbi:MAG TPA: LssY C-terminal domain-containing protein, partial [Bryobacteraceae bacterium]